MKKVLIYLGLILLCLKLSWACGGSCENFENYCPMDKETAQHHHHNMPMKEYKSCAYDGMVMPKAGFEAQGDYKGETLYFGTLGEKERFLKNPKKYYQKIKLKNYLVNFNFLTKAEYFEVTKIKAAGSHIISVSIFDLKNKTFIYPQEVNLNIAGIEKKLIYNEMMRNFYNSINFKPGIYKIKFSINLKQEKLIGEIKYKL